MKYVLNYGMWQSTIYCQIEATHAATYFRFHATAFHRHLPGGATICCPNCQHCKFTESGSKCRSYFSHLKIKVDKIYIEHTEILAACSIYIVFWRTKTKTRRVYTMTIPVNKYVRVSSTPLQRTILHDGNKPAEIVNLCLLILTVDHTREIKQLGTLRTTPNESARMEAVRLFLSHTQCFFVTVRAGTAYRKIWQPVNNLFCSHNKVDCSEIPIVLSNLLYHYFFIELWHILILWLATMPNRGMPVFTLIATGWRHCWHARR